MVQGAMGDPKGWGESGSRWVEKSAGVEIDGGRFGEGGGLLGC